MANKHSSSKWIGLEKSSIQCLSVCFLTLKCGIFSLQAAQKAFLFYNKHRLQTDPKLYSNQFDNLKSNASDIESKSGLTWSDIGKSGIKLGWSKLRRMLTFRLFFLLSKRTIWICASYYVIIF